MKLFFALPVLTDAGHPASFAGPPGLRCTNPIWVSTVARSSLVSQFQELVFQVHHKLFAADAVLPLSGPSSFQHL